MTVKDTHNTSDESGSTTYTSDARGGVYIPSSKFTVDDDKMVHFRLDVEAEAQGVRSIGSAEVEMKLGEVRQISRMGRRTPKKEGGFAERLSQMGAAYDYYKTKNWKFLGEAKIDFGFFALLSGRMEAENKNTEKEQDIMKGRLATGVLLKFAYSWTITYPVGPIPVYICFTVGVNVGFAISLEAGFAYSKDGGLKDWEFRPFNDITIDITLSFSAQAGAGSDAYSQTVFYTEAETDGDGLKRYKLKGLHIGNKQGALTRSLTYDVTDYSFDVTVPTPDFKVQTVNGTPYIYWLSTVQKENDSDPDTWRLWVSVYDP